MATLGDIEKLTKDYAEGRGQLSDRVRALEDEINASKRRHLPGIKKSVGQAMEKRSRLEAALEESASLFVKPKTMILHGVKIGFQKMKGKLSWADPEQVVKLIKKHFPDLEETLIKTTETPVKDALANLPAADLKKIGVTIEDVGDIIVIKSTDTEIDRFVNALLKSDEEGAKEAA